MNPYTAPIGQRLDVDAIRVWTAANLRARRAYYSQPNACTWLIWNMGRSDRRRVR
jgi:hypothetical protein